MLRQVDVSGDSYLKIEGHWMQITKDGGIADYATKRESSLLDEIVRLEDAIDRIDALPEQEKEDDG